MTTVSAMNSNANEQILVALQQVVGTTLKSWLDDNKAELMQVLGTAAIASQTPPTPIPAKAAVESREPKLLTSDELAARWQLHPETIRRLVRVGILPRMFVARRILVPLSAVTEYERQNTLPRRR